MAYNENINLFVTTDRNNADVFNAPLEKIIQNIQDTREYLYQLQAELDQLELKVQSEYTPTEQLNDLLAKGIKGDKGDKGTGLEFNWDNTKLGVKREDETDYQYVDLKGDTGSIEGISESHILLERVEISSGVDLNSLYDVNKVYITTSNNIARQCTSIPKSDITSFELRTYRTTYEQWSRYLMQILKTFKNELWIRGHDGYTNTWTKWKQMATNDDIETINNNIYNVKTDLENEIANIPKVTKTSELTNDSGYITANNIPTTLPASDVYAWAKASTKPTYTASEVGALASNGTAVNASKVSKALTLQIAGATKNTFNGSSAQTFNIPNASTSAAGVMTSTQVTTLNTHTTEINNLKSTVVNGKTSVANAINGKLGTKLSNQTSFADMAYYIGTIPMFSVNNFYIAGYHAPTPSGVGIKYVIFDAIAKSPAGSSSDGYVTAEFTNNAQNAYRTIIIRCNYDGTRKVTTLNPDTVKRTGTVTENLSFPEADSNVSSRITIAVFDNPIYNVKALTGDYFICIP